jgi:hypothetical protein
VSPLKIEKLTGNCVRICKGLHSLVGIGAQSKDGANNFRIESPPTFGKTHIINFNVDPLWVLYYHWLRSAR